MKRISIKNKLLLNSIIVILFTVLMVFIGFWEFTKSKKFTKKIAPLSQQMAKLVELKSNFEHLEREIEMYQLTGDENCRIRVKQAFENIDIIIEKIDNPDPELLLIEKIKKQITTTSRLIGSLLNQKPNSISNREKNKSTIKIYAEFNDINVIHKSLVQQTSAKLEYYIHAQHQGLKNSILQFFVLGIVIIIFYLIYGFTLSNRISKPLLKLTNAATEIYEGRFRNDVITDNKDEIGDLAEIFNKMTKQIQKNILDLKTSEEKYRTILENLRDVYFRVDMEGRPELISPSFIKMFNYTSFDAAMQSNIIQSIFQNPDQSDFFMEELIKMGSLSNVEVVSKHKDQTLMISEINAHLIYNADQKPVAIEGMLRDITARRRAEDDLQDREQKYRSLFDESNDGIFLHDLKGNIIDANTRALEMLGYAPDELKQLSIQMLHPEEEKETSRTAFEKITTSGSYRFESKLKRKEGSIIDVDISSSIVDKKSNLVQGIVRDITGHKKLELQIQQAQKMEAIGTLAGGIAHDFNNILSAIIGYSELLKEDFKGDDSSIYFLDQVLMGGNRARELVSQILLFSRQSEHQMLPVKIIHIVKEVKKLLVASLPSTIKFKLEILTANDYVLADPIQIHQVLMKLCTNSAHAMRKKGGTLSIELDQIEIDEDALLSFPDQQTGKHLKLQISDTGHGIAPEVMDKIFDPFFSTKSRGEGTGLGLSVVHGIIKECGGSIKAYSELGKGTTFSIILPSIDNEEQNQDKKKHSIPGGVEHILFVDDELAIINLGKMTLERLGYKVTAFSDSRTAWQTFQKDPDIFDMIITDKTMPGLTGLELSKKVIDLCPEKPILMCTGFGDEDSMEHARKIGIRDCIRKPIVKIKFAETIRKILDQPDRGRV